MQNQCGQHDASLQGVTETEAMSSEYSEVSQYTQPIKFLISLLRVAF